MVVFRTQVLITFLEPICRDYAKVNIMTFALMVVRYQNGSAIVEKDLHYHFVYHQFQLQMVINSKGCFFGLSRPPPMKPLQKHHIFSLINVLLHSKIRAMVLNCLRRRRLLRLAELSRSILGYSVYR